MNKFLLHLILLGLSIVCFNIQADSNQSPFSKKYVQCYATENDSFFGENYKDRCGPIGWASYHFVNESEVYINWWEFRHRYEDGSKVTTKYFENISFDSPSRTFKGSLVFENTIPNFGSPKRFDYAMTFNEDYSMIHKGKVKATYQDGNIVEQNYNYRDEVRGEREKNWWYVAR